MVLLHFMDAFNEQDNPIQEQEAQNVRAGKRITGKEAEHARNKAREGIRQGRDK